MHISAILASNNKTLMPKDEAVMNISIVTSPNTEKDREKDNTNSTFLSLRHIIMI
jgi:hypothetical protein